MGLLSYYDVNTLSSIKMECTAKTSDGDLGRQIRLIFDAYDELYGKKIELSCTDKNAKFLLSGTEVQSIDKIPPGSEIEVFKDADGSQCLKIKYNRRKDGDGVTGKDIEKILKIDGTNQNNQSFDG